MFPFSQPLWSIVLTCWGKIKILSTTSTNTNTNKYNNNKLNQSICKINAFVFNRLVNLENKSYLYNIS